MRSLLHQSPVLGCVTRKRSPHREPPVFDVSICAAMKDPTGWIVGLDGFLRQERLEDYKDQSS